MSLGFELWRDAVAIEGRNLRAVVDEMARIGKHVRYGVLNPETFSAFTVIFARMIKRCKRRVRMARKKRRGWA